MMLSRPSCSLSSARTSRRSAPSGAAGRGWRRRCSQVRPRTCDRRGPCRPVLVDPRSRSASVRPCRAARSPPRTTGSGMSLSMIPPCMVAPAGLGVALGDVDAVDDHLVLLRQGPDHLAALAPVLAREHLHPVTFTDPHHITSGASETMRMNRLSRSSRPDRAEDPGPAGLQLVVDQHGGVLVESDVAAVGSALLLGGAHDDAPHDVTLLDCRAGDGVFDRRDEDVAYAGVAPARARRAP